MIIERIEYERHDPLRQFQFERVTVVVNFNDFYSDDAAQTMATVHDALVDVRSLVASTMDENIKPYVRTEATIVEKSGSDDDDSIPF